MEPKISQEHSSKQKQNSKEQIQNDKLIRMEEIGFSDSFFSGDNLDGFSQNFENSEQKMIKNKSVTKQKKQTEIWSNSSFELDSKKDDLSDLSDIDQKQYGKIVPQK